ncbi:hypothetical protein LINPERHAP1_LOCUS17708 [Linum perenne]
MIPRFLWQLKDHTHLGGGKASWRAENSFSKG